MSCPYKELAGLQRRLAAAIQTRDPGRARGLHGSAAAAEERAGWMRVASHDGVPSDETLAAHRRGVAGEIGRLREELAAMAGNAVEDRAATLADFEAAAPAVAK